jgi:ABC-type phosphate transport system auxiliary subunit
LKKLDSLSSTLLELETSQADASLSKQNASKQQADAEMEASALEVIVQKQQTKLKGLQTNYAAQRCILEDAEREAKNLRSQHCATAKALQDTYCCI